MLYVFELPEQIGVVPLIAPGVAGVAFTVMVMLAQAPGVTHPPVPLA